MCDIKFNQIVAEYNETKLKKTFDFVRIQRTWIDNYDHTPMLTRYTACISIYQQHTPIYQREGKFNAEPDMSMPNIYPIIYIFASYLKLRTAKNCIHLRAAILTTS